MLNSVLEENTQLKIQLEKCKEIIQNFYTAYTKSIFNIESKVALDQLNPEIDSKLIKKLKKFNLIEEDNKRLRQLLKSI